MPELQELTLTVVIKDTVEDPTVVADFLRCQAVIGNGGADGLMNKVVMDGVQDIRRKDASENLTQAIEPVPEAVTVTVE